MLVDFKRTAQAKIFVLWCEDPLKTKRADMCYEHNVDP